MHGHDRDYPETAAAISPDAATNLATPAYAQPGFISQGLKNSLRLD
jgi:hypothetical protein